MCVSVLVWVRMDAMHPCFQQLMGTNAGVLRSCCDVLAAMERQVPRGALGAKEVERKGRTICTYLPRF